MYAGLYERSRRNIVEKEVVSSVTRGRKIEYTRENAEGFEKYAESVEAIFREFHDRRRRR